MEHHRQPKPENPRPPVGHVSDEEQVDQQRAVDHHPDDGAVLKIGAQDREAGTGRQPHPQRFAPQPVRVQLGQSREEHGDGDLKPQQPQRPRRHGGRAQPRSQQGIHRPAAVGRQDGQQRRQQADQVEVIQVAGLLQQEDVGKHQEEAGGADPVQESQGDKRREHPHQRQVDVHSIAGPRLNEVQGPIGEVELFPGKVPLDPAVLDYPPGLPDHERAKGDAEAGQEGGVYRGKQPRYNQTGAPSQRQPAGQGKLGNHPRTDGWRQDRR